MAWQRASVFSVLDPKTQARVQSLMLGVDAELSLRIRKAGYQGFGVPILELIVRGKGDRLLHRMAARLRVTFGLVDEVYVAQQSRSWVLSALTLIPHVGASVVSESRLGFWRGGALKRVQHFMWGSQSRFGDV